MSELAAEQESTPETLWSGLDDAWREAFRQAWEAFRTGNIPVGACAATQDGAIVHASRNRADEVGVFATLVSRFGAGLVQGAARDFLRSAGQASMFDLVERMQSTGEAQRLAGMTVEEVFGYLWPELRMLAADGYTRLYSGYEDSDFPAG